MAILDKYGRLWPDDYEVCLVCNQPDNCGDCDHNPYTSQQAKELGAINMETPKWRATDDPEYDEAERQLLENEWLESARKYITLTEECDCDCWLCQQDDHFENHCGIDDEKEEEIYG